MFGTIYKSTSNIILCFKHCDYLTRSLGPIFVDEYYVSNTGTSWQDHWDHYLWLYFMCQIQGPVDKITGTIISNFLLCFKHWDHLTRPLGPLFVAEYYISNTGTNRQEHWDFYLQLHIMCQTLGPFVKITGTIICMFILYVKHWDHLKRSLGLLSAALYYVSNSGTSWQDHWDHYL